MTLSRAAAALIAGSVACHSGASPKARIVHVSAAVSLKEPIEALARTYEAANPETQIRLSLGASGDLATQIERGAPADLFASAAQAPATRLIEAHLAQPSCTMASNRLVLIRRAEASLSGVSWATLASDPGVKRIALGLSPSVPAGAYAEQTLSALGLLGDVTPKLVRGANVRQVLDWVARGEADAGVVYATDAVARTDVVVVGEPPEHARPRITYPLVIAPAAGPEAREFAALLCSNTARNALAARGFGPP
jgi:molybdate transport system substrate-binding protein